jgi:hypothetical protein
MILRSISSAGGGYGPINITYKSTGTTTIPTGTLGKTKGFLGIMWQTGFNNSSYPTDVVSPGWTKIAGITKLVSGTYWRSSIQYKILTLAELGTSPTYITYTGGSEKNVSLFETTRNINISSIVAGSVFDDNLNDPTSHTINPSTVSNRTVLYFCSYYGFSLNTPVFSNASYTEYPAGGTTFISRFHISPPSVLTKPIVTVDLGSNAYSHMSGFYLKIE